MKNNEDNLAKVADLLFGSIDGTISPEQFAELEKLLQEDSSAMDAYIDLVNLTCSLSGPEAMIVLREICSSGQMNEKLWQALGSMEEQSPIAEVEMPQVPEEKPQVVISSVKRPKKKTYFVPAIAVAALLMVVMVKLFMPVVAPVATITDQAEAVWQGSDENYASGQQLYPGNFVLTDGYAELTFADGAVVVVESPADFNLESSSRLYLHGGKVCALVAGEATGFCVRTDKADIIDLGTEFGVSADDAGNIDAHVFQGKIVIDAGGGTSKYIHLKANQSVSIDNSWKVSQVVQASTRSFVRDIETVGKWQKYLGKNLIINPGFENDAAGRYTPDVPNNQQITNIAISGWNDSGPATIYRYIHPAEEGFPLAGVNAIPADCGKNFFVGVDSGDVYQDIDFEGLAALIDGRGVLFSLSGWIGGYDHHADTLEIIAVFMDGQKQEIQQFSIGPVLAAERENKSDFLYRSTSGTVPAGSASVRLILRTKRNDGIADAYADNLKFSLSAGK